jgi:hypothetical protein
MNTKTSAHAVASTRNPRIRGYRRAAETRIPRAHRRRQWPQLNGLGGLLHLWRGNDAQLHHHAEGVKGAPVV